MAATGSEWHKTAAYGSGTMIVQVLGTEKNDALLIKSKRAFTNEVSALFVFGTRL